MNKDECIMEAKRRGIDIEGMSYQQMMKAVAADKRRNPLPDPVEVEVVQPEKTYGKKTSRNLQEDRSVKDYKAERMTLTPEMAPTWFQLYKYDEVLSDKTKVVKEVEPGELVDKEGDYRFKYANYRVKSIQNRPTIAKSTLPLQNPGITFDVHKDITAVVSFKGEKGYIWKDLPVGKMEDGTVMYMQGVSSMLREHFPEYLERFGPDNLFYIGTTKLCCGIDFTNGLFREITRTEKKAQAAGLD